MIKTAAFHMRNRIRWLIVRHIKGKPDPRDLDDAPGVYVGVGEVGMFPWLEDVVEVSASVRESGT